jgi:hypothetical protein
MLTLSERVMICQNSVVAKALQIVAMSVKSRRQQKVSLRSAYPEQECMSLRNETGSPLASGASSAPVDGGLAGIAPADSSG